MKKIIVEYNPYTREANYFIARDGEREPYTDSQERLPHDNVVMSETADSLVEIFAEHIYAGVDRLKIEYYGCSDDFEAFRKAVANHEKNGVIAVIDKCNISSPSEIIQDLKSIFEEMKETINQQNNAALFVGVASTYTSASSDFENAIKCMPANPDNAQVAYKTLSNVLKLLKGEVERLKKEMEKEPVVNNPALKEEWHNLSSKIEEIFTQESQKMGRNLDFFFFEGDIQKHLFQAIEEKKKVEGEELHRQVMSWFRHYERCKSTALNEILKKRYNELFDKAKTIAESCPYKEKAIEIIESRQNERIKNIDWRFDFNLMGPTMLPYKGISRDDRPYKGFFNPVDNTKRYGEFMTKSLTASIKRNYKSVCNDNIKKIRNMLEEDIKHIKIELSNFNVITMTSEYQEQICQNRRKKRELEGIDKMLAAQHNQLSALGQQMGIEG